MPMTTTAPGTATPSASDPTGGCCQSGSAGLERTRYFARQLLTPDDMTQEQDYLRARLRRHNRLIHGWGVVCGCGVRPKAADWTVTVEPGYVLGPQGDEILVDTCVDVDISRQALDGNAASSCADAVDPWCSGVRVDRRAGDRLYVAVAYAECPSRPVRVQPAGCGCDGGACEYSRVREGYVVRVLDRLPESYAHMSPPHSPLTCPKGGVRACPDCVNNPWVILATIVLRTKTITDRDIDNITYRRHVASFGGYYLLCGSLLKSLTLDPPSVLAGSPSQGTVTLSGPAPIGGAEVDLASADTTVAKVGVASVIVPETKTSATFPIATLAAGQVAITASYVGPDMSATLTSLGITALTFDPPVVFGSAQSLATVSLSGPAPAGIQVLFSGADPSFAAFPPLDIPAGATLATFPVAPLANGQAIVTAELGITAKTASLTRIGLVDLEVPPEVTGAVIVAGRVTLNSPPPIQARVFLNSDSLAATVPAEVVVPAGSTSAPFQLTTTGSAATANISASLADTTLSRPVRIFEVIR